MADNSPTLETGTGTVKADKLLNEFTQASVTEIVLVIFCAWVLIVIARFALPPLAERAPSRLRLYLLGAVPILRLVVLIGAILWIVPIVFNITFQNFLVIAGGTSVAIGFAFKDYVSSIIAGIVAVFERPYRPGDWVTIGEDYGEVTHVGLRALTLRTPDDDIVTIGHERIWTDNIANSNDGAQTLMCVADFHLHPDHDAATLREALRDVALTSAYLSYADPVLVIVTQTPLGTHYRVKAYPFDMRDQFLFISDLTVRGKEAIRDHAAREIAATPAQAAG